MVKNHYEFLWVVTLTDGMPTLFTKAITSHQTRSKSNNDNNFAILI